MMCYFACITKLVHGYKQTSAKILRYFQITWHSAAALATRMPSPESPRPLSQQGLLNIFPVLCLVSFLGVIYLHIPPVHLCICNNKVEKESFIREREFSEMMVR